MKANAILRPAMAALAAFGIAACDNMGDQARLETLEVPAPGLPIRAEELYAPAGTLPRGPEPFPPIAANGEYVTESPLPLSQENLARGRELYGVHCAPCHGPMGYGDGIVVRRGFPAPPSYHTAQLRAAPIGYLYDVIAHGYGVMAPYRGRIAPEDRWRIAAFVRVLQWSQHATPETVPPEEWSRLEQHLTAR